MSGLPPSSSSDSGVFNLGQVGDQIVEISFGPEKAVEIKKETAEEAEARRKEMQELHDIHPDWVNALYSQSFLKIMALVPEAQTPRNLQQYRAEVLKMAARDLFFEKDNQAMLDLAKKYKHQPAIDNIKQILKLRNGAGDDT